MKKLRLVLLFLVITVLIFNTAYAWQNMFISSIDSYADGILTVTIGNCFDIEDSLIDSELIQVDGKTVESVKVSGKEGELKTLSIQVGDLSTGSKHELKLCTKYQGFSEANALFDDNKVFTIENDGDTTLVKIVEGEFFSSVAKGSKGEDVQKVQQLLIDQGYLTGVADGDFGNKTEKAVMDFQKDHDLPVTGIVDDETFTVLSGKSTDDSTEAGVPEESVDQDTDEVDVP